MTLAAVWKAENGRINAIADTRISFLPGQPFTDHGPKILPLTVICRKPSPSGFFDQIGLQAQFGFVFAGNTLTALSSLALANILCGNLVGNPDTPPPSLDEIAYSVGVIAFRYTREIGIIAAGRSVFSSILFGRCPRTNELLAFEFQPNIGAEGLEIKIDKHVLNDELVVIIGDQRQVLRDRIEKLRAEATHTVQKEHAPRWALKSIINEGTVASVGGRLQQAWISHDSLNIIATMDPITPTPPSTRNVGLFALGFDTMDMQMIGPYKVALSGL